MARPASTPSSGPTTARRTSSCTAAWCRRLTIGTSWARADDVTWSEFWYPVARIGGLTFANDRAALALAPAAGGVRVGLFPTTAMTGKLTVTLPGAAPATSTCRSAPTSPSPRASARAGAGQQGQVAVTLVDAGGETLFEWQGAALLR